MRFVGMRAVTHANVHTRVDYTKIYSYTNMAAFNEIRCKERKSEKVIERQNDIPLAELPSIK